MGPIREKLAVWSPHRDSHSVMAFKAMLSLRDERWVWHDEPQRAIWWILDGLRDSNPRLTAALVESKSTGLLHGALLAPHWSAMRDPAWVFFKVPLQIKHIYSWVDSCLLLHPASPAWEGHTLQLRRWPNMSRYGAGNDAGAAVLLTAACAQLLKNAMLYEDLLRAVPKKSTLDALLTDALRDGILEMSKSPSAAGLPHAGSAPLVEKDHRVWSLVKRLISKYS